MPGVEVRLVQAADEAGTARAAREAVDEGARAVIASGGDGTVHTVLQDDLIPAVCQREIDRGFDLFERRGAGADSEG